MYRKIIPLVLFIVAGSAISSLAQGSLPDLGIQVEKNLAVGIVKSIDEKKVVLETKDGMLDVIILSMTEFKRLPPDNLSLKAATASTFSDIEIGDRTLVIGKISFDKKNITTKTLYLVKNSELKAIQDKQRQDWRTRGIAGKVSAVDPATKEITVEIRGITGNASAVKVSAKPNVKYLRYAENSVKYQDAVESDFTAVQAGDMLQALGDRSEDQLSFKAEQVLTGAFVTVAGPVKSVDIEKNEVTVTDLKTKSDVTIAIKSDSLLKKFPEETAQQLARVQMMMKMRAAGITPPSGGAQSGEQKQPSRQPDGAQGERRGGGIGQGGMRGGDINEMINGFPTITLGDLKPGDMIAASSPKGKNPNSLTAIKLLAGVEPFLTAPQMPTGRSGARGRGSVEGGLTIPGLDGPDF